MLIGVSKCPFDYGGKKNTLWEKMREQNIFKIHIWARKRLTVFFQSSNMQMLNIGQVLTNI